MILYMACGGISYEGGTIFGVYTTKDKAQQICDAHDGDYDWTWVADIIADKEDHIDI